MADEKEHPNPEETPGDDALDPDILELLRQVDSGGDASFLDDTPLAESDPFSDEPVLSSTEDEEQTPSAPNASDTLTQQELADLLAAHEEAKTSGHKTTPQSDEGESDSEPDLIETPIEEDQSEEALSEETIETAASDTEAPNLQDKPEETSPTSRPTPGSDELEELVRQLDEREAESEGKNASETTDQQDLDALIDSLSLDQEVSEPESTTTESPDSSTSASLNQNELDELISGMAESHVKEESSETEKTESEASPTLNQSDLDALIEGTTNLEESNEKIPDTSSESETGSEEEPTTTSGSSRSDTLSQSDLDALISGMQEASSPDSAEEESLDEESATLNQEDLDALISANSSDENTEPAESGTLNQSDLDALIEADTSKPDSPSSESATSPLSQDDLDALIEANTSSEPPKAESTDEEPVSTPLSQDDLDELIQGMAGGSSTPESPANTEGKTTPLTQDDLDAIIEDSGHIPSAEPSTQSDSTPLSQEDLDALIGGLGGSPESTQEAENDVVSLSDEDIDALDAVTSSSGPGVEAGAVTQDDIDALLAGGLSSEAPLNTEESGAIPQDLIDGIISGAQDEETKEDVGSENVAAAGASSSGLLTQDDLDAIMEQARAQQQDRTSKASAAIAEAVSRAKEEKTSASIIPEPVSPVAKESTKPKPAEPIHVPKQSHLKKSILRNAPRIAASVLIGALTGAGVFATLDTFKEKVPPMETLGAGQVARMRQVMSEAKDLMEAGDYTTAQQTLEAAIATAEPGPLKADAIFAALEARCLAFHEADRDTPKFLALQGDIGSAVDQYPDHKRVPEALYWKAKLYEMDDRGLYAARDVYKRLLDEFPGLEQRDVVLLDAAKVALELPEPEPAEAFQLAQQILNDYPGSSLAGKARLVMADAYAEVGQTEDARTLYLRTAQAHPNDALGAEAYLRVAELAYNEGKYQTAISHLETRLQSAPTTIGNDSVYLLLGRAQRRLGDTTAAENTLTDLLNFFPESSITPEVYIELSQVLFDAGEPEEALNRAQEAVIRYGYDPDVLRNQGQLLGITGDSLRAAEVLVKADQAGTNDPALLLTAARHYRAAGRSKDAVATYDRLRRNYPVATEAVTGAIESANLLFDMNKTNDAIKRLDDIERSTRGTDKHVEVLASRLRIYNTLGFYDWAIPIAELIPSETSDPELLAQSVQAMADAAYAAPGQRQDVLDLALATYAEIDKTQLSDETAHSLTQRLGNALVQADPRRGLNLLEQAYFDYPQARTRDSELELLDTYLRAQRMNDARRMVMQLAARVREHPADTPYLIDAATTWGNHLYDSKDYRLAAEAFKIAVDASEDYGQRISGNRENPDWAKFQWANALLNLEEYSESRSLFDEIAAGNSEWAADAAVKSKYAAMEESRRGFTTASVDQG